MITKVSSQKQSRLLIEEAVAELIWAKSIFQNKQAASKYLERAEQKIEEAKKNLA